MGSNDVIYYRDAGKWVPVKGRLKQVSVGAEKGPPAHHAPMHKAIGGEGSCFLMKKASDKDQDNKGGSNTGWTSIHCHHKKPAPAPALPTAEKCGCTWTCAKAHCPLTNLIKKKTCEEIAA